MTSTSDFWTSTFVKLLICSLCLIIVLCKAYKNKFRTTTFYSTFSPITDSFGVCR